MCTSIKWPVACTVPQASVPPAGAGQLEAGTCGREGWNNRAMFDFEGGVALRRSVLLACLTSPTSKTGFVGLTFGTN
jgi:hypothetical protein